MSSSTPTRAALGAALLLSLPLLCGGCTALAVTGAAVGVATTAAGVAAGATVGAAKAVGSAVGAVAGSSREN